jgi:glycosyltransferase involved in cell wall biosynthesis
MRILMISNFYPPLRAGGYAQLCHEVVNRLHERGHDIRVLTSNYQANNLKDKQNSIFRVLHLDADLDYYKPLDFFRQWAKNEKYNITELEKYVRQFNPQIAFVWGMWALSRKIPKALEVLLPHRVVYYLADYWPVAADMHTAYWQLPANKWYTKSLKRLLAPIALSMIMRNNNQPIQFEHVICVSKFVKDALIKKNLAIKHAKIIYNGIEINQFQSNDYVARFNFKKSAVRLLYAGQLVHHKGVHTAIEALTHLIHDYNLHNIKLTIIGGGHPSYETYLSTLVEQNDVQDYVSIKKPIPRDQIPNLIETHDILVFPSIYDEPLARITMEAMMSGMVVVGTTTGGTRELLEGERNGLTFSPEDSAGLARQLKRLISDPQMCLRLSESGRKTILDSFTMARMIDEIEEYLLEVKEGR